ncbi:MAG TPA: hypothetical protein ENH15_03775, partial [Actinobacteria bacterium]|nr:hypothetical protein [Actinomycetota bacterium]
SETIAAIGEIGVYLLLFGIGLKLKIGSLVRPEVWGTATAGVVVISAVVAAALLGIGVLGFPMVSDLDLGLALLLGFAFSFSSTVFAVKILDAMDESGSLSGRVSVGVLVVQDVFAVTFLALLARELPSLWALPMVLVVLGLRPVFGWLVSRSGHGELLVLLGFTFAVGVGAAGFDLVGLKPELGALIAGIVVSSHPRAGEMADRLLDFKDFFLVGFFLSIGLAGTPPLGAIGAVVLLMMLLPLKSVLFFYLFTRFRLRSRTALQSSLNLSTYSEFGLIVAAASLANGLLDQEWVSVIAVAVAASFVLAAAANGARQRLAGPLAERLARLERQPLLEDDAIIECGYARAIVFGMGRIGVGAFDELVERRGSVVVGVDRSAEVAEMHQSQGRNVVRGNALDRDFWERLRLRQDVELVVVAMDNHLSNVAGVERAREFLPKVRIASIARYPDQVLELQDAGVDVARNLYEEAGQGLADDAVRTIWEQS